MTNDYINEHFGMERAQFERDTAALLFKGGNIGCETSMNARNVKSEHVPGKQLVAFAFKCLSKERNIVHTVYMVFENKEGGDYIPSPCSCCSCENGAFFCSHMLSFLYFMRAVQTSWSNKTQQQIQELMPEDRRITAREPCLLEMVLVANRIKRQMGQSNRHSKRQKN